MPGTPQELDITLKFLQWQKLYEVEKPFQIFINIPKDAEDPRDTNLVFETVDLKAQDVRTLPVQFALDTNGFIYRQHVTKVTDFTNRAVVEQDYLPEIDTLLRKELDGVDRVFFFDWRVRCHSRGLRPAILTIQLRKNAPEVEGTVINMNDLTEWLRPAVHVHIGMSEL